MKIFPISDMHLEFHHQFLPPYRGLADVIVCAGDMHTKGRAPKFLRMIFDHQEIIYIAGNHEYYGSSIEEQDELLRKECKKDGIHFLQRDKVEIDGVTFAGCTLWSDFKLFGADQEAKAITETRRCLRDYHVISFDKKTPRIIEPNDTIAIHGNDIAWLHEQFTPKPEKLVVVTQHGSSIKSLHPAYAVDIVSYLLLMIWLLKLEPITGYVVIPVVPRTLKLARRRFTRIAYGIPQNRSMNPIRG